MGKRNRGGGDELVDAAGLAELLNLPVNEVLKQCFSGWRPSLPPADLSNPRKVQWRRREVEQYQREGKLPGWRQPSQEQPRQEPRQQERKPRGRDW